MQQQIVEKQGELSAARADLIESGEWNPNLDELWIAQNDGVQKALDAVEDLLNQLEAELG